METLERDQELFERLLELERPLVEAIWRQVIYGSTLKEILATIEDPTAPEDGLEERVRELVCGTYRHIQRIEAGQAAVAN